MYGKSVIVADVNETIFKAPFGKSISQVKTSHNTNVIRRTLNSGQCELISKDKQNFINNIFEKVKKRNGKGFEQPYNIARYYGNTSKKEKQKKLHEIVEEVKEKVEEIQKMSQQVKQPKNKIRVGDLVVKLDY